MNEFFKIRTKTSEKDFKVRKFTKRRVYSTGLRGTGLAENTGFTG